MVATRFRCGPIVDRRSLSPLRPPALPKWSSRATLLRMVERSGGTFAAAVRRHVVSRPVVMTWMRRVFAGSFVTLSARLALASR